MIHRTNKGDKDNPPEHPFTRIDNRIIDGNLSPLAKLALIYLLSKPDNWELKTDNLRRYLEVGRNKTEQVIRELKLAGHLDRRQANNANGKKGWTTITEDIYEAARPELAEAYQEAADNSTNGRAAITVNINLDFRSPISGERNSGERKSGEPKPGDVVTNDLGTPDKLTKEGRTREGATPARPPSFSKNHSAIKAVKDITGYLPNKILWANIIETIGEKEDSILFWKEVIAHWIACGYNKLNIDGMLDHFERKELPSTKPGRISDTRERDGNQAETVRVGKFGEMYFH